MDPELMQELLAFLSANPQYTTKGDVKPVSLDEQAKRTNYQQDQMQSFSNPLFMAMLGGGQGFDMRAFEDVEDGEDTFDVPSDPLAPYLQLPDSEEFRIASGIAEGKSPEQIVALFRDGPDKYTNSPDDKKLDRVRAAANTMFKDRAGYQQQISSVPGYDPSTGEWAPPEGGQYVGGKLRLPKFKRSDVAQVFDKAGLPTPDKMFGPQDFGWDGSQEQTMYDNAAGIEQLSGATDTSKGRWQDAKLADSPMGGTADQMQAMLQKATGPLATKTDEFRLTPSGWTEGDQKRFDTSTGMRRLEKSPEWEPFAALLGTPALEGMKAASARGGKDQKYAKGTAQGDAYARYTQDVTAQRKLERQAAKDDEIAQFRAAYANRRTSNAANSGLTPMTMEMLRRAQALRQIGG